MSHEIAFDFNVKYHIHRPVEIGDVIDSLNGLAKLIPGTLPVFREYDRRHAPRKIACYVKSIEEGSLKDNLLVKFIFKDEPSAERWIQAFKDKTGISFMEQKMPFFAPVVNTLIILAGIYALKLFIFPSDTGTTEDNSTHITLQKHATAIIQSGSGSLGLPPEVYRAVLEKAAQKPAITRAACTFVKPAKGDNSTATISLGDSTSESEVIELPQEVIAAIPEYREATSSEPRRQELEETLLCIRSCDLDFSDKGWNAIVPAVSDKRLPLTINQGVNRERLVPGKYMAHVVLEYVTDNEGNRDYKRVALESILPQAVPNTKEHHTSTN